MCKTKKVHHWKNETRKECNKEEVQRENRAKWRKYKDRTKLFKKRKRRAHYPAKKDNGLSINSNQGLVLDLTNI